MTNRETAVALLLMVPICTLMCVVAFAVDAPTDGALGAAIGIAIASVSFMAAGGVVVLWQGSRGR